ncbi:putative zinc-binding metallopeptidase [Porphyromonas macacae]|uniref:putative zinc-binding metallopeptidase n=1 Tax=Porphyromonas macacae TaxID=28115 RepID=UPI000683E5CF|nr:putative zinc-binding metallopeptidase [Porphyromonas macacae]
MASDSVIDKYFPQEPTTELDRWAIDLFKPYNIQTLYRWQKEHLPSGSFGIPPKIEQVKPVLEAFKMLLLDLYTLEKAGGKDFFKDKGLIRITLLGGFEMHENNVLMKLWYPKTASNEMFAFDVNAFDPSDKKNVYRLMRSLHHQFARRLIEHIPYNRDAFLLINPKPMEFCLLLLLLPMYIGESALALMLIEGDSIRCIQWLRRRMSLQRLSVRYSCIRL